MTHSKDMGAGVAADPQDMGAKLNNINVSRQCLVLLDESKINTIK